MTTLSPRLGLRVPDALPTSKRLEDIVAVKDALNQLDVLISDLHSLQLTVPGTFRPFVGTLKKYLKSAITINKFSAWVGAAQLDRLDIQILKNGTVIKALTIDVGLDNVQSLDSVSFDINDVITVNVANGNGKDLVLRMDY